MTNDPRARLTAADRLSRTEFERRYAAMPHLKKAELIEGVVYMGSPVSYRRHGRPKHLLAIWLGFYEAMTPGVEASGAIDWFRLERDDYVPMVATDESLLRSTVFPGLWLPARELLNGDVAGLRTAIERGAASAPHRRFCEQLAHG